MEKKEFLNQLKELLVVKGVSDSVADEQIVRIDSYLTQNGSEDVDVPVEEMANGIIGMLMPEASADNEVKADNVSVSAEEEIGKAMADNGAETVIGTEDNVTDEEDAAEGDAEDNVVSVYTDDDNADEAEVNNVEDNGSDTEEDEDADMKIVPQTKAGKTPVIVNEKKDEYTDEDVAPAPEEYSDEEIGKFSPAGAGTVTSKPRRKNPSVPEDYYSRNASEGEGTNKTLFWVLFFIAIPFVIALALAVVAIYIGFWVILAALMIGCIAGLIAFVTVGVLISLIGIVYGVIQLIKGIVPIGLFEIGLGVIVGAAVLFVGILVYNFAIRFIPFAMKQLTKLLKFAYKKGKEGIVALKGVCESL